MTKAQRASRIVRLLIARGRYPILDRDDDIGIEVDGRAYLIVPPEGDECYSIMFVGIRSIHSEEERERTLAACLAATAEVKCAKAWIHRNSVAVAYEANCASPEAFVLVFDRAVGAMRAAGLLVQQRMR